MSRPMAMLRDCASPVAAVRHVDFAALSEQFSRAPVGEKDGPAWMPADIEPGPRKAERVRAVSYLVLDIEAKAEPVKGDDGQPVRDKRGAIVKRVTGAEPPDIDTLQGELAMMGWEGFFHTSYSHTPEHPRYRLVLDTDRPLKPSEVRPLGLHVAAVLGLAHAVDVGCLEPARLFYTPRVPADRATDYRYKHVDGRPLPVDALLGEAERAQAALRAAPKRNGRGGAVIDAYNAAHDVGALLVRHGYRPVGRGRWIYAESTTGMPGVRLLPDSAPERIFSSHGGDPLNDGRAHDAFDVFRILEHGGDVTAAVRAAATLLGLAASPARVDGDVSLSTWPVSSAALPVADGVAWTDPMPLPDALPPVAEFDAELLPEALRGWICDIAERMQCPPDFSAVAAMVGLSSLIGARIVVSPKARDDWRVVPNLWGNIVGRAGVLKSPSISEALKPLHRLEAAERDLWAAEQREWQLSAKVAELAAKKREQEAAGVALKDPAKARALLESEDLPDEPKQRRYVVNDTTVEKLAELLEFNEWGLLAYRDELHGLLASMDRQGQEGARAFYLQAYDGNQGFAVDRIIRGSHYIPRVCLSLLGSIQPGRVQTFVRDAVAGGSGDDGLLQRFGLSVWPDVSPSFEIIDRWPDTPARQKAGAVFDRLNALQPASDTEPVVWRFSPEAQGLFYEWLAPFEREIRGDELHPSLVSHLAKYRKLVPALALICAVVDTPGDGLIHERELIRALAWADYLRTHAERLYSAALVPETSGAHALLAKIRGARLVDADGVLLERFAPWEVAVKHWAGLATPEAVRKAAEVLAEYGWLARVAAAPSPAGGRPSERYAIHPLLLKGGAS